MALPCYYEATVVKASNIAKAMKSKKRAGRGGQVKKAKRVSKIARGRFAKALVLRGSKLKTSGGLKQEALMRNKRGKVVSKRQSAQGKRAYTRIEDWTESFMAARRALDVSGFVAINGRTLQGKALYIKTKALQRSMRGGASASA